jgi:hypothetical protein
MEKFEPGWPVVRGALLEGTLVGSNIRVGGGRRGGRGEVRGLGGLLLALIALLGLLLGYLGLLGRPESIGD